MSRPGETICHPGIIEEVGDQMVYVKILSASACASCQAKGACYLAESAEKIIEVKKVPQMEYTPGKSVEVIMTRATGTKAVILAYLIPLVLVVLSLFILIYSGIDEGISALIALLILVPYYFVLYLIRDKLRRDFEFSVITQ